MELPISIEQRIAGAEKVGEHKTSMLQDLEARRPMELEPVVGAVVELGEKLGISMPYTSTVYAVHETVGRDEFGAGKDTMNRWVRLIAAVAAMIMNGNMQYAWTLFVTPMIKETGWKLSDIQWAFTLYIFLGTVAMPLCGWMIDRIGPRAFMSIAGLLCGVGWAAMGSVHSLHALYVDVCDGGLRHCLWLRLRGFGRSEMVPR